MAKKLKQTARRFHIMIWEDDMEFLKENFSQRHRSGGVGEVIRDIVHMAVGQMRTRAERATQVRVPMDQVRAAPTLDEESGFATGSNEQ